MSMDILNNVELVQEIIEVACIVVIGAACIFGLLICKKKI